MNERKNTANPSVLNHTLDIYLSGKLRMEKNSFKKCKKITVYFVVKKNLLDKGFFYCTTGKFYHKSSKIVLRNVRNINLSIIIQIHGIVVKFSSIIL